VQQPDGNAATRAALWGNRTLWGPLTLPWPYIDLQPFTRQRTAPLWAEGLAERTPRELVAWTLANAGARPWDRDAVDQRLVAEVADRGGAIRDAPPEGACGEWKWVRSAKKVWSEARSPPRSLAAGRTGERAWRPPE
jgi:hypothetical protein